jgi:NADPH:quinone reductase-like Zn-dependent oxidoreductase
MPTNHAAVITGPNQPLQIIEIPYPTISTNEILIENKALALNPADWKLSLMDLTSNPIFKNTTYPFIAGEDCAGIVVDVGARVKSVVKGDRVIAGSNGVLPQNNHRGGFQRYVVVPEPYFGKIPTSVRFEEGVVVPLGMMTAARGLFEKNQLGMAVPPLDEGKGKTLFVWGGSSSVGVNATQLAAVAGYEVISVASRHNFELCKSVGATEVFDYKDANFIEKMTAALKGKDLVGCFNAIGTAETCKSICEIIEKSGTRKRLTSVAPGTESFAPEGFEMTCILTGSEEWKSIASHLFNWVGEAMEQGVFKPKPDPWILGRGLEHLQKGVEEGIKGYSGKKLVVTL